MKHIIAQILLALPLVFTLGWNAHAGDLNFPTQEQIEAQEFLKHLNQNYRGLGLKANALDRTAIEQMDQLEDFLQVQDPILLDLKIEEITGRGGLTVLTCTKIVCGGGGGSCTTCLH